MKLKQLRLYFVLGIASIVHAQENSAVFMSLSNQPTKDITISKTELSIKYLKPNHSMYEISTSFNFKMEQINYSMFGSNANYQNKQFQSIGNTFLLKYKKNKKVNYKITLEPTLLYEKAVKLSDFYLFGMIETDLLFDEKNQFTIGILRSTIFGKPSFLPKFTYNYLYNKKIKIGIGFPDSSVQFIPNTNNIFSLNNSFNGTFYNTYSEVYKNSKASFSQMTSTFEYQKKFDNNWFVIGKLGYDFNKKYQLLDSDLNTKLDFAINDSFNFGITIKYKY